MTVKEKLQKLGYKLKFIDSGGYGSAFDIGSNRVIKITTDKSEAYTAIRLLKGNLKYVNKIYRVFKFKGNKEFIIEQEKLKRKNPDIYWAPGFDIELKENYLKGNLLDEIIDQFESSDVQSNYKKDPVSTKLIYTMICGKRGIRNGNREFIQANKPANFKKFLGLLKGLENINMAGIDFFDTSSENVMQKGSEWLWIDVGANNTKKEKIEEL